MTFEIKKAERKQIKARVGFFGNSGTGKTKSGLLFAKGLVEDWSKIVVIDSENGRSEAYADMGDFSVLRLDPPYSPARYIEAIEQCENAGFECIMIDSISHEWMGQGGILEIGDKMGNSVGKWSTLTPLHNSFVQRIQNSSAHIICCGRTKESIVMDEVIEDGRKKTVVTRVPTKIETREGFEYEMLISFFLEKDHTVTVEKDNTGLFDGEHFVITEDTGSELREWIMTGKRVLNALEQQTANFKMYTEDLKALENEKDFNDFIATMKKEIGKEMKQFFGEDNYAKITDQILKKKEEFKAAKIKALKEKIKEEKAQIENCEQAPTDTDQFRKALAKQKENLAKLEDELKALEAPEPKKDTPKK